MPIGMWCGSEVFLYRFGRQLAFVQGLMCVRLIRTASIRCTYIKELYTVGCHLDGFM